VAKLKQIRDQKANKTNKKISANPRGFCFGLDKINKMWQNRWSRAEALPTQSRSP